MRSLNMLADWRLTPLRWPRTMVRAAVRVAVVVGAAQALAGCSRFVWHEDPFTPDPAPATEVVASGGDTTYVLRGPSYYLLARQRSALWNREVLDDVAWRYRTLFGEAPPLIAVRLDSAAVAGDSVATWRGVPLAVVAVRRRGAADRARGENGRNAPRNVRRDADPGDSVQARLFAGPMLAATAAETWLRARTRDAVRASDDQPGGPSRAVAGEAVVYPAWIQAGALRWLGSAGAVDRSVAEVRADLKGAVPLSTLFDVRWPVPPNAAEIVRVGVGRFDADDDDARRQARARERSAGNPGGGPLFIAQSVSVLGFVHERDPVLVSRLADELARGRRVADVLATSATLPHDVAALDTEWRKWLRRAAKRR